MVEARERTALATLEVGRDLDLEDAAVPAILNGLPGVPKPCVETVTAASSTAPVTAILATVPCCHFSVPAHIAQPRER